MPPAEAADLPDAVLVVAAQDGDREAFTRLVRRHGARLHAYLMAFTTPDRHDDLMQETLLAAWHGLPQLREVEAVVPWMFGIARNQGRKAYRRIEREAQSLEPVDAALIAPVDQSSRGLHTDVFLRHLQGLPEAYRTSLALRLLEGCSGEEIASVVGLTVASVRVNLHRGLKLLRESLGKEGYP